MNPSTATNCLECNKPVVTLPTIIEYQREEIFLFHPVVCEHCLYDLCELYSTQCANCGGCIPPYSNVGVLKGEKGQHQYIHMKTSCTTPGNAFYGYWGKGQLGEYIEVEACS